MPIHTAGPIRACDWLLVTRHKALELCPVIAFSCIACLKGRRFCVLLHGVPLYAVGRLDCGMRCIRFVIICTVVPSAHAAVRRCLNDTVSDSSERCTVRVRKCGCNLRRLSRIAAEYGRIIKCSGSGTAGHLIPLTAVRSIDNGVRTVRLFKLGSVEHLDSRFFSVSADRLCGDMSAGDLRIREIHTFHMRHIIAETAIGNIAADRTGHIRCSGRYGRDGFSGQCGAVTGCHTAESSTDKADRSTGTHPCTAVHDRITDIRIALETVGKACGEPRCRCTCTGCGTASAEHAAGTSCASGHAGDYSCSHQQFHAHTGAGLGYIQSHCREIAVKFLCRFEERHCTEQPQEHIAVSVGQGAACADVLANRG